MKNDKIGASVSNFKALLIALPVFWLSYFVASILFSVPCDWTAPSTIFMAALISASLGGISLMSADFSNQKNFFINLASFFLVFAVVLGIYFVLLMPLASFLPGQADRLRSQIGAAVEVKSSVLPELDVKHAPLVPFDAAYLSATQALSQVPALGSRFRVGDLQKQRVGDSLEWVGFLEPKGFFSWFSSDGTPGYVRVSATDASDVELVTSLGGKPLGLRYTDSSYFGNSLDRKLFFHDPLARYEDMSPEIDDSGRPFYVVTRFENNVGFFNHKIVGITILDPQTGEATDYDLNHVPAWVDRVYPQIEVLEQVQNWGQFVHGRFNFSGLDKMLPSSVDLVYSKDGEPYFAIGLSAKDSDTGVQGFLFVNTRTKAVARFDATGISEARAQDAAENVFAAQRYRASNAIPFLINGEPTYVMSMSLSNQIVAYAMVSMSSYERVATGKTPTEAYNAFSSLVGSAGLSVKGAVATKTLIGVVDRIAQNAKSGLFALRLSHNPGVFFVSPDLDDEVVLTQPGDNVEIEVSEGSVRKTVISFKNNSLK